MKNLSYGEQRQIEVILALATKPRLLLLDEPTAGLSAAETTLMVSIIKSLPREITIILIEHDMDVAFEIAEKIAVLYFGSILAEGTLDEIKGKSQSYGGLPELNEYAGDKGHSYPHRRELHPPGGLHGSARRAGDRSAGEATGSERRRSSTR